MLRERAAHILAAIQNRRAVVLGDLLYDSFVYGDTHRISREAPVPILSEKRRTAMLGGAGNLARNLSSLGGEVRLISVAGTVFAITIAAVVYASGSYGPRLLANFMEDRGNQLSLATFIATFVYAVLVLRVVRDAYETAGDPGFVPQLSLMIATGLMAASIAVLVYFLNHVPASIRINAVLEGIGERLLRSVRQRFPQDCGAEQQDQPPQGAPVAATGTGYIQIIDFAGLDRIARDAQCRIELRLRPGDFVHPDVAICHVEGTFGEGVDDRLRRAFAIGDSRTSAQDIEYLLDELVEIGLRALSPGINDPFTAITCLHWLSAATALLAKRDLACDSDGRPYGEQGVYALADDFDHFVRRGFGGIRAVRSAGSDADDGSE